MTHDKRSNGRKLHSQVNEGIQEVKIYHCVKRVPIPLSPNKACPNLLREKHKPINLWKTSVFGRCGSINRGIVESLVMRLGHGQ